MVHYRGRYRRRPMGSRSIFRRMTMKHRRPIRRRRRTRNIYTKASKMTNRNVRQYHHLRHGQIPRLLNRPNMRIYRTSQTTQQILTAAALASANGVLSYDWKLGDVMMSMERTWITSMYEYFNLLGFVVMVTITDTSCLVETVNTGAALTNYAFAQVTQTGKNSPDIGFYHCTDSNMQSNFIALNNTVANNRSQWFSNPKVQRLTQNHRVYGKWHQYKAYQGIYQPTTDMISQTTTLQSLGVANNTNEPHGFALCWFDVGNFLNNANVSVTLQITASAIWQLKEITPGL